jgi:hypothetical protein
VPITLYHRTTSTVARDIMARGFKPFACVKFPIRDDFGTPLSSIPKRRHPIFGTTLIRVVFEDDDPDDFAGYDVTTPGDSGREYLIPSDLVNARGVASIVTDDEQRETRLPDVSRPSRAERIVFFHRTEPENAARILSEGFKPSRNVGSISGPTAGVWLSTFPKKNTGYFGSSLLRVAFRDMTRREMESYCASSVFWIVADPEFLIPAGRINADAEITLVAADEEAEMDREFIAGCGSTVMIGADVQATEHHLTEYTEVPRSRASWGNPPCPACGRALAVLHPGSDGTVEVRCLSGCEEIPIPV